MPKIIHKNQTIFQKKKTKINIISRISQNAIFFKNSFMRKGAWYYDSILLSIKQAPFHIVLNRAFHLHMNCQILSVFSSSSSSNWTSSVRPVEWFLIAHLHVAFILNNCFEKIILFFFDETDECIWNHEFYFSKLRGKKHQDNRFFDWYFVLFRWIRCGAQLSFISTPNSTVEINSKIKYISWYLYLILGFIVGVNFCILHHKRVSFS